MSTDPQLEQIFNAIEQLRAAAGDDGPRKRKLVDTLFRHVHNLKAKAAANGLNDLAAAAHEFENTLHALRKNTVEQSLAEGAKLYLIQTSFDIADFDREFQSLKERLCSTGEVISTSPRIDKERPGKVNFRIVYARKAEAGEVISSHDAVVSVEEISRQQAGIAGTASSEIVPSLEDAFEKFAAALANLPSMTFGSVFQQALQAGRAAAGATGKDVAFETRGSDLELDNRLCEPLMHLVRNAVDHGIETRGKVIIEIARRDDQTTLTVTDDGRGIDPSLLEQIFQPGFSTATEVSSISGRGVGLDVVKTTIEELGGSITVNSEPGHGTTFKITLLSVPNQR